MAPASAIILGTAFARVRIQVYWRVGILHGDPAFVRVPGQAQSGLCEADYRNNRYLLAPKFQNKTIDELISFAII